MLPVQAQNIAHTVQRFWKTNSEEVFKVRFYNHNPCNDAMKL